MRRRTRFLVLATFVVAVGGSNSPRAADRSTEAHRRPNFVFFLADDMGWRDAGCYGSTFYETPNIDRLAKQGMRFTNAYAACPVCSPTRASIMTGKYPARLGTTDYFGAPQPDTVQRHWTRNKPLLPARYLDHLPVVETTIAKALQQGRLHDVLYRQMASGRQGVLAGGPRLRHQHRRLPGGRPFELLLALQESQAARRTQGRASG